MDTGKHPAIDRNGLPLEVGDWVRYPSLNYDEPPYKFGKVVHLIGYRNGNERCEIRAANGQYISYPAANVDKLTEEESLLAILEHVNHSN